MNFGEIVTAVFIGNCMTAWFLVSARRANKGSYRDQSWGTILGLLAPCLLFIGVALTSGGLPPSLAALALP